MYRKTTWKNNTGGFCFPRAVVYAATPFTGAIECSVADAELTFMLEMGVWRQPQSILPFTGAIELSLAAAKLTFLT